MPSRKATTVQTPRPQIVVMSATGATLLLPDVRQEQAVEVQYGYRFKGKWKPSQVVDRLAGSPVCVTVAGLKPSRTYVFRARAQASADVGSSWGDWSAASDTGKTSADLAAAVSAQLPAAHGRKEPIDRHRDPGLDHRDALRERPGRPVASAAAGPGPPSAGRREDADLAVAIAASLAEASGTAPAVAAPAGSLYDSMDADLAAAIAASIADVRQSEAAEEAEPPCDAMPAEDLPPPRRQRDRERVRERPRELDQRTPQQEAVEQDEQWQLVWHRLYRRSERDAVRLRETVLLVLLVVCTMKLARVQAPSLTGAGYLIMSGLEISWGIDLNTVFWTPLLSAVVLLIAFARYIVIWEADETPLASSWISWAWSTLWLSLHWVAAAFQWSPTPHTTSVADQEVSHDQVEVGWRRQLWMEWERLWQDNPAGTFWFDHWIAALLATCVIVISCCSLVYSFLRSSNGLAKKLRHIVWSARHWLKAVFTGSFAFVAMRSGAQGYWLQSEYVAGYCVLWLSSLLWVATLDAISDALGRPSTFTPERVLILFASMFLIGLPLLFCSAPHGVGWRVVSPLVFGLGVDGFGRAFVSGTLRDLAYLPIRLLAALASRLEMTVLNVLRRLTQRLLRSRLLRQLVAASPLPCTAGAGSSYILLAGHERLAHCQPRGSDHSCVVGAAYTCIAVCGILAAAELFSRDNIGRARLPVFCTIFAYLLASVKFVTSVALPRSARWVYETASLYTYRSFTILVALLRRAQVIRLLQAAQAVVSRAARSGTACLCWVGHRAKDLCICLYRAFTACWTVVRDVAAAASTLVYHVARAVWRDVSRIASAVWAEVWRGVVYLHIMVWRGVRAVRSGLDRVAQSARACLYWVGHRAKDLCVCLYRAFTACWTVVRAVSSPVWTLVCHVASAVWRAFWPPIWWSMCRVGVGLRNFAARIGRASWRYSKRLFTIVHQAIQQFTRAYWRLLPTALAVQTAIRFGLAPLRSPPPAASAALGFALASVAVAIIATVLVRDLFMRTSRWSSASNRQYIATDRASAHYVAHSRIDNMLLYVDLGAVAVARWTVTNAGNILRLLIEHGATGLARMLRETVKQTWRIGRLICNWGVLPVLKRTQAVVLVVWDSPVLSSAAALGSLWLLWAHHSGIWRWHLLERIVVAATTSGSQLFEATTELVFICGAATVETGYELSAWAVAVLVTACDTTTQQLVAAAEAGNIESPRLAWVVWMVIVVATKSQTEIRIKTLMWPFVVLWLTALMGGAQQLPQVTVGVLFWCGAGVRVRNYEQRERDRVRDRWDNHRRTRPAAGQRAAQQPLPAGQRAAQQPLLRPTGRAKEPRFRDQTECSICLEDLRNGAGMPEEEGAIGMLPCGHCFHSDCVGQWLSREARCPLCRQAAHGIDRVLEIMF